MPVIELVDVHYQYPDPRPVFTGLDLAVSEGEAVGIVGPNGAGKTTLFLLLAGILQPDRGDVRVLGAQAGSDELRGRVGVVFQGTDDQLFSTVVEDDIAFGPLNLGLSREEVRNRVREALAAVGLEGFEQRVPHHLSSGEKRKVALASVLSMRPELLLLDEPTSDLDSRSRRELSEWLVTFPGTRVIASHDFEFLVESTNRILVLGQGSVRAQGDPLTLLSDPSLMTPLGLESPLGLQALKKLAPKT